jgi:hypothetical protein
MPAYRVNTALMAELRALLHQAAKEELRQGRSNGKRTARTISRRNSRPAANG